MHEYLLVSDPRFRNAAIAELESLCKQKIRCDSVLDKYFSAVSSDSDIYEGYLESAHDNIFTYALLRAQRVEASNGLPEVSNSINSLLTSGRTFRIFVRNIDHSDSTPREAEIALGSGLDSEEHHANLSDPDDAICVLFTKNEYIIGISKTGRQNYCIENIIHPKNTRPYTQINRAELKLEEAIAYFGIDMRNIGTCIDVGASPGGWTDLMLRNNKRTVSIDNAPMAYKELCRYGPILIITESDTEKIQELVSKIDSNILISGFGDNLSLGSYGLIHIKSNVNPGSMQGLESVLRRFGKADALLIDCNVSSGAILSIVVRMSWFLTQGSMLVYTLKINRRNVMRCISEAVDSLSAYYTDIKIKKLVHNRRELTLVAKRK